VVMLDLHLLTESSTTATGQNTTRAMRYCETRPLGPLQRGRVRHPAPQLSRNHGVTVLEQIRAATPGSTGRNPLRPGHWSLIPAAAGTGT
jgi:hypothetical protein